MAAGMSDQDVRAYAAARDLVLDAPGIRGIGVIERVARTDLASFVKRQRAGGRPDFKVAPAQGDVYGY